MGIPIMATQLRRRPQADPMGEIAQGMTLRSLMEQREMNEMKLRQAQQQQADQQAIRRVLSDPNINWSNPLEAMQTVTQKAAGRVSPETLLKLREGLAKNAKEFVDLDKAERDRKLAQNSELYQYATSILSAPTPEAQAALYTQVRGQLIQSGTVRPQDLPEQYDPAIVATMRGSLGLTDAMFKLALEEKERKAKEEKAIAEAKMATQEAALTPQERANLKQTATAGSEFERSFFRQYGRMPTEAELIKFRKSTQAPPQEPGNYLPVNDATGATVGWVNPKSGHFKSIASIPGAGGPIPPKPSGQERSRAAAAIAIIPLIDDAEKLINNPSVAAKLGVLPGRVSEVEKRLGNLDPEVAELYGTLKSIYSLGGTMHGWRALQVANEFEKAYGGLHTSPATLLGGLRAMRNTAETVAKAGGKEVEKPSEQTGGTSGIKIIRDANGRIVGIE